MSLHGCNLLKRFWQEVAVTLSGCREKNGSNGRVGMRLKSKPLQMNGSARETRNSKSKIIRKKADDIMCEHNGDDGASTVKTCPRKSRISKEVSKKECKIHKRVQLNKSDADVHFPNKTSVESIKIEDNEGTASCHASINGRKTKHKSVKNLYKCKRNTPEVQDKDSHVEILLPQGIQLSSVASIDMLTEDVGHALQFLEFCEAFGQVNATLIYFSTFHIMEPRIEPRNPVLIEGC